MFSNYFLFLFLIQFIISSQALFGYRTNRNQRKNTSIGPCTINNSGQKCTTYGYYEIVQCEGESCYCVTPHSNLISYDTRTNNSKIAPKCGTCLIYLEKLFSNGDPPNNLFVPRCDVSEGNFEPIQCDIETNKCFCVNPSTGKEILDTRVNLNETSNLKCSKIDFSIDPSTFPSFEKADNAKPQEFSPVGKMSCLKNRDSGKTCNENKPSIKYWFDAKTFQCFPFEFKGCGGNENSYTKKSDCYSDCVLADYFSCALQSRPARKSDGTPYNCGMQLSLLPGTHTTPKPSSEPQLDESGCPLGYTCQMGPFFGICCEQDLTKKYRSAFKPACKNGKTPKQEDQDGWSSAWLGKSCSDNFCPSEYNCESNQYFSYCCPK